MALPYRNGSASPEPLKWGESQGRPGVARPCAHKQLPEQMIRMGGIGREIWETATSCFNGGFADRQLRRWRERFVQSHADAHSDTNSHTDADANPDAVQPLPQLQ